MRSTFLIVTLMCVLAVSAFSAEVSASNLVLLRTYLKTTDVALSISNNPAAGFSPTTVTCPKVGCVLGIEVQAQFSGLNPPDPNDVGALVTVDGVTTNVFPNGAIGLDSTSTGGGSNAHSFSWMTANLTPGTHVVNIEFFVAVAGGGAGSADRSMKISVYRQ